MLSDSVAIIQADFKEGAEVLLTKVIPGIPHYTKGVIDFVDDCGFIFVETEGHYPNFRFTKADFGKSFVMAQ